MESLVSLYEEYSPKYLAVLRHTGDHPATLIDFQWRLDHIIRTEALKSQPEPMFLVEFTFQDCQSLPSSSELNETSVWTRQIRCNFAQVQDMLYQVQSAQRQVNAMVGDS